MPNEWPRFAHGKLVKAPDGEIVGPDYTTLGRSAAPPFPEVTRAVQPDTLGLPGLGSGSAYPEGWADHGAMLFRPAYTAGGQPWYLVTRYRLVEEYPGKPATRSYALSMTVAVEPKELDFPVLFQSAARPGIEQFPAKNLSLPPLAVPEAARVPLPAGWFDRVRPWLVALASGRPFGSHEPDTPIDGFLEQALWAVACLPAAIRWRVPVAAGVYTVPAADKAQLVYALTLSHKPRAAGTADTGTGEAYADWFAGATENGAACRTVQDVLAVVGREFPDLATWDDIPPADDWRQAVKAIGELKDLKRLQDWADRPTGPAPALDPINRFRPAVLELAEKHLAGPPEVRTHLLAGVTAESWKPAWQAYARKAGETALVRLGELVGPLPFNPAAAAQARAIGELPPRLAAEANRRLSAAYPKTFDTGIAAWGGAIRQAFAKSPPAWFTAWATVTAPQLAWGAAALQLNMGEQTPTAGWAAGALPPAAEAMKAMLESKPPGGGFDELLKLAKQFPKLAEELANHVEPVAVERAYQLAVEVGHKRWLEDRMKSATPSYGWLDLAVKLCQDKNPDVLWANMLVKHWAQVSHKAAARNALLDALVENRLRVSDWQPYRRSRDQQHRPSPDQPVSVLTRLGELVGKLTFHPDAVEWLLSEPTDLNPNAKKEVQQKLTAAFDAVTEGGYGVWAGVVRRAFAPDQPGWFAEWAKPRAARLAWAAASLQFLSDVPDPTADWKGPTVPPVAAAMRAMLRRQSPPEGWTELLGLATDRKSVARELVKLLEATDLNAADQLASESGNEDLILGSVSGSTKHLDVVVQGVVRRAGRNSETTLKVVLENWDQLKSRRQEELRPALRPHLGVTEWVLLDTGDELSVSDKVSNWVWPVLKKLVEGDTARRRRVLRVTAKVPGLVQSNNGFKEYLLNPLLNSADLGALAADGGPVLQFALALRDSRDGAGGGLEFPEVKWDEVWSAELWKPVLQKWGRAKTKPATLPLRSPAQLPIAHCFSEYVHYSVDDTFWKGWLAFLATEVPKWYLDLLKARQMSELSLWRFAQGWDKVKSLRPDELHTISRLGLKNDYLQAANAGKAANALPVEFVVDTVAVDQFCPNPDWWRYYFQQALDDNDPVKVGILWIQCVRHLSKEEVGEMKVVLEKVFGKHKEKSGIMYSNWFSIAKAVIEKDDSVKAHKPAMLRRLQSYL